MAWDAGVDGRAFLDPLCRAAPDLLSDNGFLLLVHSEHADVPKSLAMMEEGGLTASIVARQTIGFGPVLLARAAWLEANGLIVPGCRIEELAVILAQKTLVPNSSPRANMTHPATSVAAAVDGQPALSTRASGLVTAGRRRGPSVQRSPRQGRGCSTGLR